MLFYADSVTFTEEILITGKLHFLCNAKEKLNLDVIEYNHPTSHQYLVQASSITSIA